MYRVLVVEDNETLNNIFCRTISDLENFKVCGSYLNCENAVTNLKSDLPDLVLMDI